MKSVKRYIPSKPVRTKIVSGAKTVSNHVARNYPTKTR